MDRLSAASRRVLTPSGDDSTPAQIGRFVVLRKLGEGGMGVVYAAYDEELERKVAIKLLRSDFHGQRQSVGQARLLREAQAMARLSHPNIVQVYEVGKLGSGVFLAMEFVHGCDLREWRQRATRPWRDVLAIYIQAGQGLAAAHVAGIVHRDFKPENVLVGEDQRVRVVDFGLARPGEVVVEEPFPELAETRGTVELTQAGAFIGTPAYMAPEQLRCEPADARSDQFSFCVALFEALYGLRPFPGASTAELRDAVLNGAPLVPRETEVPSWVYQALTRGLHREPERRYRDMPELVAALASDPSAVRRRRLGITAVILGSGLAAATAGMVVYEVREASAATCRGGHDRLTGIWDAVVSEKMSKALVDTGVIYADDVATRVVDRLDRYAEAWAAMHTEACETHRRGEQSDALFDARMSCLDDRRTAMRVLVEVLVKADKEVVEKAVQAADGVPSIDRCGDAKTLLAQRPPPEDPLTAQAVERLRERRASAWAKQEVGQYKAALAELQQIRSEAEALEYTPLLAAVLHDEGVAQDTLGDYKAAEATLTRAVTTADGAGDDERRVLAQIDLMRAVGLHQARFEEGLRHAEFVRGALARLVDEGPMEARLEARIGEIYLQQGDVARAEPHIERSLELHRQVFGETSAVYAHAVDARGTLRFFRNELGGALADYRQAVAIQEEAYGLHHPMLGTALNNVGAVELTQFANDAAQATFRRTADILRAAYGETHPSLGAVHSNLGIIALHQGRRAEAVAEFRRALTIYEALLPADHPTIGDTLLELGQALLYAGEYAAAEATYARALAVFTGGFGAGHAMTTRALAGLGNAQLRGGDAVAAEKSFDRALTEYRGAAEDAELGAPLAGLGRLMLARGRVAEAVERLTEALVRLKHSPAAGPYNIAEVQFLLAQALWQGEPMNAGRSRELAAEARANFIRPGAGFAAEVAEVEAWQARLAREAG
ncbi:MAG: serine/threonine protein kinase [Myxococcales bacterium]|nr:serine/threonine protein kinase [Myxococcales bacterium]